MELCGKTQETLCCSFCGKRQNEVAQLIAGASVYICNQCVALCQEIIEASKNGTLPDPPPITNHFLPQFFKI